MTDVEKVKLIKGNYRKWLFHKDDTWQPIGRTTVQRATTYKRVLINRQHSGRLYNLITGVAKYKRPTIYKVA